MSEGLPTYERYGEAFWRAHHKAWCRSDLNQRGIASCTASRSRSSASGAPGSRPPRGATPEAAVPAWRAKLRKRSRSSIIADCSLTITRLV